MKNASLLFLLVVVVSCGQGNGSNAICRPQEVAIAECIVEEYEKNPSGLLFDYQKKYCTNLYPIDMCYYR